MANDTHTIKVEKLATLLNELNLTEIEVEDKDGRVKVSKSIQIASPVASQPTTQTASVSNNTPTASKQETSPDDANVISSPMVGTVYLSPSPGAPEFVTEGKKVKVGDVLCLIEAMKMFNKIKADKTGVVSKIYAKNEHPIEFGAPLFAIDEA